MFYKHFKGKFYLKLFNARHCDDCTKEFAVYVSLYKKDFNFGQVWIRRLEVFNDTHPRANVKRLRKLSLYESILLITGLGKRIK